MVLIAIVLIVVGLRSPGESDPLATRLADFSTREKPLTLEEIELSHPFSERVLLPFARRVGAFAARFTPQASLDSVQHHLDLAGNQRAMDPTLFCAIRIMAPLVLGVFLPRPSGNRGAGQGRRGQRCRLGQGHHPR